MITIKYLITTGLISLPLALTGCNLSGESASSNFVKKAKSGPVQNSSDEPNDTETSDMENYQDEPEIENPDTYGQSDVEASEADLEDYVENDSNDSDRSTEPKEEMEHKEEKERKEVLTNPEGKVDKEVKEIKQTSPKSSNGESKTSARVQAIPISTKTTNTSSSAQSGDSLDIKQCLADLCAIPGKDTLQVFLDQQNKASQASIDYLNKNFKDKIKTALDSYSREGEVYQKIVSQFEKDFSKVRLNEKQLRTLKYLAGLNDPKLKTAMNQIMLHFKDTDFMKAFTQKYHNKNNALKYFTLIYKDKTVQEAVALEAQLLIKLTKEINEMVGIPVLSIQKPVFLRALYQDSLNTTSLTEIMNNSILLRVLNAVLTSQTDVTSHIALKETDLIKLISKDIKSKFSDRRKNIQASIDSCSQALVRGIQYYGSQEAIATAKKSTESIVQAAATLQNNNAALKKKIEGIKVLSPLSREQFVKLFSQYLEDIQKQSSANEKVAKYYSEPEALTLAIGKSLLAEKTNISCDRTIDTSSVLVELIEDEYLKLSWIASHSKNLGITEMATAKILGDMIQDKTILEDKHLQCLRGSTLSQSEQKEDYSNLFATGLLKRLGKTSNNNLSCGMLSLYEDKNLSETNVKKDLLGALRIQQTLDKKIPASCLNLQSKIENSKVLGCKQ